jgi:3'-5' exoribonuclease
MSQVPSLPALAKALLLADAAKYEGQTITDFFAVAAKQVRHKKDGSVYLWLKLSDRSGQCEAVMWDNLDTCVETFEAGDVVKVRVDVASYNAKIQLTIKQLRKAAPHEYERADFQPHTTYDLDELWTKLCGFVASFTDAYLKQLVTSFLEDPEVAAALRAAPAAKYMHHAWIGGLLEHIVSLLELSDRVTPHYPQVNRDLVMTGAILHDIGKLEELRWGFSFEYTLQGQLLGHITQGIAMIEKRASAIVGFPPRLLLMVEHIVLSHHGRYEYGSPKLPMTPEAILFHYLDDLDAKLHTVRAELDRSVAQGRPADEMTDYIRALERPLLDTRAYLDATDTEVETKHALPAED